MLKACNICPFNGWDTLQRAVMSILLGSNFLKKQLSVTDTSSIEMKRMPLPLGCNQKWKDSEEPGVRKCFVDNCYLPHTLSLLWHLSWSPRYLSAVWKELGKCLRQVSSTYPHPCAASLGHDWRKWTGIQIYVRIRFKMSVFFTIKLHRCVMLIATSCVTCKRKAEGGHYIDYS